MNEQILNIYNLISSQDFKNYFLSYLSILIIGIIIGILIGSKFIKMSDYVIYFVKNYTSFRFGGKGFKVILVNNFLISLLMMYIFYSTRLDDFKIIIGKLYFIWMGLIIGIGCSKIINKYNFPIALSLIVPHGIVEIPTIIFAISFGWILSGLKADIAIPIFIYTSLIIFILILISTYIETHITLKIFDKLMVYYHLDK